MTREEREGLIRQLREDMAETATGQGPQRPREPAGGVDWAAVRVWVGGIVDRKLKAFADREIVPLAGEVATDVAALEKRIANLEARAGTKPRVVEDDAAA